MGATLIGPLTTSDTSELLEKPLSFLGYRVKDRNLLSRIRYACIGYPGLIHLFCHTLIDKTQKRAISGQSDLAKLYTLNRDTVYEILNSIDFINNRKEQLYDTLELKTGSLSAYTIMAHGLAAYMVENKCRSCKDTGFSDWVYRYIGDSNNHLFEEDDILQYLQELRYLSILECDDEKESSRTYRFARSSFLKMLMEPSKFGKDAQDKFLNCLMGQVHVQE